TNDTVAVSSTDPNAALPANTALVSGTKNLSVTLKTAGSATVTASDVTDPAIAISTSPVLSVAVGAFTKLQTLLPGEFAVPGNVSGKGGSPTTQTAGTPFNVTVNAVDANWNLVTNATDTVSIGSSDSNATLPANGSLVSGTQTFSVTLNTAGS